MCRIVGFIDFAYKNEYDFREVIEEMRDTMIYGGPDDEGSYIDPESKIALGHRRLSILDLSMAGHQPMSDEEQRFTIVYNGEVYNFKEIRNELIKKGYKFLSNTDTEVVLKSFIEWGVNSLNKFRGMFAYAIWDAYKKELYLFRDRIGVKPLYYYYDNSLFMFASELKPFHKHPKFKKEIESLGLYLFLQFGYIPSPTSIFKNTYKLPPAHYLKIDATGNISINQYWKVPEPKPNLNFLLKDENKILEELEDKLLDSFKLRMVADVPVGVFLSGGIDSTTITTLLQSHIGKIKTFTIGFYDYKYNEAEYAKNIATYLGTEHTELYCGKQEALDIVPKLPELYDEPFGDASAIPTYLVSKLARNYVKVALSGDGGDELFGGYKRYYIIKKVAPVLLTSPFILRKYITKFTIPILKKMSAYSATICHKLNIVERLAQAKTLSQLYLAILSYNSDKIITKAIYWGNPKKVLDYSRYKINSLSIVEMGRVDLITYLPDVLLVKLDRATMGVSLEGREPFLDHTLVEYALNLPEQLIYKENKSKYILKQLLKKKYNIPEHLIERAKQGFGLPGYSWILEGLKELFMEVVKEDDLNELGFNPYLIKGIRKMMATGKIGSYVDLIWFIFIIALWKRKWY